MLQEASFLFPWFKNLSILSQDENTDTIEKLKLKMFHTTSKEPVASKNCDAESIENWYQVLYWDKWIVNIQSITRVTTTKKT